MSYGSCLAGTFEKRFGVVTQFQIMNPSHSTVHIQAYFLNKDGNFEYCTSQNLEPLNLMEIDTTDLDVDSTHGTAYFFSVNHLELGSGVAGLQRRLAAGIDPTEPDYAAFAESSLAAIPDAVGQVLYTNFGPCNVV